MHNVLLRLRNFILPLIDFFYPPFRRWIPLQTFRYLVSGSTNTLLGFLAYYVGYHYILNERMLDLGFYAFKSHIGALFISFCVALPIGFFMSKYLVFNDSALRGRIQFFRYFMICLFNLGLNYILLKILVEYFHLYPVLAQVFTIIIVVIFSYLAQRHFSFRVNAVKD